MEPTGPDFIATELLKELKEENSRKNKQIQNLHSIIWKIIIGSFIALVATIGAFLVYLYQYDFVSTSYETTTNSAEGFYAVVDSNGNVIGQDFTEEQIENLLKGASDNGEGK